MPGQRPAPPSPSLQEDRNPPSFDPSERRREERRSTSFEATMEFSNGGQTSVILADVSLHGCCVRTDTEWLRQGAFVSIGMGAEPKMPAIVRWIRGSSAGMEFLRQVPVDHADWHDLMSSGLN
ncbi:MULTISPECIES: PilZ domain-containing protein [Novosphingobium]|uniref:PilZ domain-containing protein n=1 Tax=Novosphingobium mathurense TaxID=428990 RepID=A0A1U6IKL8_9SPHN|nr:MULTISPECIES: PilZ domain-containing protein [Novosphingobium]CDO39002.1 hypothetical protein SPHV1_970009 [Novosphingobium sp. KN65.2]SLK08579.1 PilZ domain-containing protein [Novosphingobium mathurense]